jgi:putative SOS response-associated peptidase YedK
MCGRYASSLPAAEVARLFRASNRLPVFQPHWNVAPSQLGLVVRRDPESGERRLDALRWGLLPSWTRDPKTARRPINARAETVATLPSFRGAYARRHCLVPATAFYEWEQRSGAKQPYAIARADGAMLAFAGLWEGFRDAEGEVTRSYCIVTTAANAEMAAVHDRMPVILEAADWPLWLGETAGEAADLLHPSPPGTLRLWPVSRRVNAARNDDASLLDPIQPPGEPEQFQGLLP